MNTTATKPPTRRWSRQSGMIDGAEAVVALLSAGYGALFVLLDDFRDQLGVSPVTLGALIGVGYLTGFLARVALAPLADRGHMRRLVIAGVCLNVAGLVGIALSTAAAPLLLARATMGLGEGMAIPAVRRIAVVHAADSVGHRLGRLESAEMVGFAAGPATVALFAGRGGHSAPLLAVAAAALMVLPFVARAASVDAVPVAAVERAPRFAFDLLRQRSFVAAVTIGAGFYVTVGTFDALWSVTLADLGTSAWIPGLGSVLLSVPLIVFAATGGRIAQRVGPLRTGAVGLVLAAAFMLSYGFVPSAGLMFAVALVHWLSDGLTCTSRTVAVGIGVPVERQAAAQGLLGGVEMLVAGIAAIGAGAMYGNAGRAAAFGLCAALALVAAATSVTLAQRRVVPVAPVDPVAALRATRREFATVDA